MLALRMCQFSTTCKLSVKAVLLIPACPHWDKTEQKRKKKKAEEHSFVFIWAAISRSRLQREWRGMISIKTGCCLKASSCQAELPLRHRHHNRGRPSHNSVWLAQGENGSLWRVRRASGWQVCICEARLGVYLLSFCLLIVSSESYLNKVT